MYLIAAFGDNLNRIIYQHWGKIAILGLFIILVLCIFSFYGEIILNFKHHQLNRKKRSDKLKEVNIKKRDREKSTDTLIPKARNLKRSQQVKQSSRSQGNKKQGNPGRRSKSKREKPLSKIEQEKKRFLEKRAQFKNPKLRRHKKR